MTRRTGKLLADVIYYGHLVLALAALASLPALLVWPQFKWVVVAGVVVTLGSWLLFGGCTLSAWEYRLRERWDPGNLDPRPFVQRYFAGLFRINVTAAFTKRFGYSYAALLVLAVIFR